MGSEGAKNNTQKTTRHGIKKKQDITQTIHDGYQKKKQDERKRKNEDERKNNQKTKGGAGGGGGFDGSQSEKCQK